MQNINHRGIVLRKGKTNTGRVYFEQQRLKNNGRVSGDCADGNDIHSIRHSDGKHRGYTG